MIIILRRNKIKTSFPAKLLNLSVLFLS